MCSLKLCKYITTAAFQNVKLWDLSYAFFKKNPENNICVAITGAVKLTAILGSELTMDNIWPKENAAFATSMLANKNIAKFSPVHPKPTI